MILFGLLLYRFCQPLVSLIQRCSNGGKADDDEAALREVTKVGNRAHRDVSRRSVIYVGLNQVRTLLSISSFYSSTAAFIADMLMHTRSVSCCNL